MTSSGTWLSYYDLTKIGYTVIYRVPRFSSLLRLNNRKNRRQQYNREFYRRPVFINITVYVPPGKLRMVSLEISRMRHLLEYFVLR